ncbi:MAG: gluconate 2-dehydrogenase subunit 3 family protein [Gammaproteobacteria bacterium]|nr:gluconate 2-dehydrogenase subunit 3 family protein [Gammaproteobacteria bacterium]
MNNLTRKDFLKFMTVGFMGISLPAVLWNESRAAPGREGSRPRFFQNPQDYTTLEAFVDRLIPPDTNPDGSPSPGAQIAGVADYIDFLLGAFGNERPFIFAGGPFSDRNPFNGEGLTDGMASPLVLTDNQRLAWRIRILGTAEAAERESDRAKIAIIRANNKIAGQGDANGDLPGFRQIYTNGIAALRGLNFTSLSTAQKDAILNEPKMPAALATLVPLAYAHSVEGMYGNPEYGGNQPSNRDKPATGADGSNRPIGWQNVNFEGDRQPLGYTVFDSATGTYVEDANHPVSTPNPNDPALSGAASAQSMDAQTALTLMMRHLSRHHP